MSERSASRRARGECTFRKRDVERAIKAVTTAGLAVSGVEVDKDGKIRVLTGKLDTPAAVDVANSRRGKPWRILDDPQD